MRCQAFLKGPAFRQHGVSDVLVLHAGGVLLHVLPRLFLHHPRASLLRVPYPALRVFRASPPAIAYRGPSIAGVPILPSFSSSVRTVSGGIPGALYGSPEEAAGAVGGPFPVED